MLAVAAVLTTVGCAIWAIREFYDGTIVSKRNFYGVLRVQECEPRPGQSSPVADPRHDPPRHAVHGARFSPAADDLLHRQRRASDSCSTCCIPTTKPLKVGVIGLGTGTLAYYGAKGDVYRFYDINPAVMTIAQRDFTYLQDSDATIELVLGDARLSLEREPSQQFDVLVIDAFSSDAIPGASHHDRGARRLPEAHEAGRRHRVPRHEPVPEPGPGRRRACRTRTVCT